MMFPRRVVGPLIIEDRGDPEAPTHCVWWACDRRYRLAFEGSDEELEAFLAALIREYHPHV